MALIVGITYILEQKVSMILTFEISLFKARDQWKLTGVLII